MRNNPDEATRKEYNTVRNQVRRLSRKKIRLQEKSIASNVKDNPKKFWNYVQTKTKTKTSIPDLYKDNDKKILTSSDTEKASVLADFFSSVFTEESNFNMPELDINPNTPILNT
jgi:hypothetical protein